MSSTGAIVFSNGLKPQFMLAGDRLRRIHLLNNVPIWFGPAPGGPPQYRFDAPEGEYRTLYAAAELAGAFCETVLHTPVGHIVRREFVEQRGVTGLILQRDLKLAMLHSEGLLFHGCNAQILTGKYEPCRALALALYKSFSDLDGIAYRSMHNNAEVCVALYDRVTPADFAPEATVPLADMRDEVDELMINHGASFDTSPPIPKKVT